MQAKPLSLYTELLLPDWIPEVPLEREPTWNMAPSLLSWVFRSEDGKPTASLQRWGLVPFWAKAGAQKPINARAESAAGKPYFRKAWQHGRCLVPADGWFEWIPGTEGKKPMFIRRTDGQPVLFAGLCEEANEETTFAVVTTSADAALSAVHSRRPVALSREDAGLWLDPATSPEELEQIVARSLPGEQFEYYEVNRAVNNARNDGPHLLAPKDSQPEQLALGL